MESYGIYFCDLLLLLTVVFEVLLFIDVRNRSLFMFIAVWWILRHNYTTVFKNSFYVNENLGHLQFGKFMNSVAMNSFFAKIILRCIPGSEISGAFYHRQL